MKTNDGFINVTCSNLDVSSPTKGYYIIEKQVSKPEEHYAVFFKQAPLLSPILMQCYPHLDSLTRLHQ